MTLLNVTMTNFMIACICLVINTVVIKIQAIKLGENRGFTKHLLNLQISVWIVLTIYEIFKLVG